MKKTKKVLAIAMLLSTISFAAEAACSLNWCNGKIECFEEHCEFTILPGGTQVILECGEGEFYLFDCAVE